MAKIEDVGDQEYFSRFIQITGERGTVLVFTDWDGKTLEQDMLLAEDIAKIIDEEA